MSTKLLAANIFTTKSADVAGSLGKQTEIDYAALAMNILVKFIDVLEGAAIIAVGIFLTRYVKHYISNIEATHERQRTALNLLEKISSGFILVIAITLGLKVIGLDLTILVSVLTLGLSFGLGDVVKNYVAGLLILFKSPFEIGDVIAIRSFTGKVEKIEFQSVAIRTFDYKEVTIQNSDLLTQSITNYSKRKEMRLEINLSLGYGSDMQRALKIFDKILTNHPAVLKSPRYSIVFKSFDHVGTNILIRLWVKLPCNALQIKSELALQMQEAFDEAHVFAPYAREEGITSLYAMTEARKQRLRAFYGQPMLADIAAGTAARVAETTTPAVEATENGPMALTITAMPVMEYADAEEPE